MGSPLRYFSLVFADSLIRVQLFTLRDHNIFRLMIPLSINIAGWILPFSLQMSINIALNCVNLYSFELQVSINLALVFIFCIFVNIL